MKSSFLFLLFPPQIHRRRHTELLLEALTEIERVVDAHFVGNLRHRVPVFEQELRGFLHADDAQILAGREAGYPAHFPVEGGAAQAHFGSQVVYGKLTVAYLLFEDGLKLVGKLLKIGRAHV